MLRSSLAKNISSYVKSKLVAHCESGTLETSNADTATESSIKPPQGFDNLKNVLAGGTVNSFDGFRAVVQKQVNLNTVVNHFFWLGSQVTQQPIYQYRIILPLEDGKLINVASDAECNSVEGEVKIPLAPNITAKTSFVLTGEKNQFSADVEFSDRSSTTQVEYAADERDLSISYMQVITPYLTLGGSGRCSLSSKSVSTAVGGILQWDDNFLAAQWDDKIRVLYTKKVNPNRVHLNTDLLIDVNGDSKMSVSAEYFLKQSRLSMSIDSNVALKSLLETNIAPGVQLQLGADVAQFQGQYKFGCGIMMG